MSPTDSLITLVLSFAMFLAILLERNYFVIPPKKIEEIPKRITYTMIGRGLFLLVVVFGIIYLLESANMNSILVVVLAGILGEIVVHFFKLNTLRELASNKELLEALTKQFKINKFIEKL